MQHYLQAQVLGAMLAQRSIQWSHFFAYFFARCSFICLFGFVFDSKAMSSFWDRPYLFVLQFFVLLASPYFHFGTEVTTGGVSLFWHLPSTLLLHCLSYFGSTQGVTTATSWHPGSLHLHGGTKSIKLWRKHTPSFESQVVIHLFQG